jgi:tetratricopeptide (TPR) repeat protein
MAVAVLSERELEALRSFARRIDPADAGAHNNLGVLYHQKGLVAEAIEQFTHALELDPRMETARANLEIAFRASGHYDRRVAELQERLRRAPQDRDARWELGRAYGRWATGTRQPSSSRRCWPGIPTTSRRCCSSVSPTGRADASRRRPSGSSARATAIPRAR